MSGKHRSAAPGSETSRRRFLAGLLAVFGLGSVARLIATRATTGTGVSTSSSAGTTAASTTSMVTTVPPPTSTSPSTHSSTSTTDGEVTTTAEATTTTGPSTTSTDAASTSTQPQATVTTTPTVGAGLILLEKASWGAQPVGEGFVEHTVTRITVHHTAAVLGANANAPGRIRQHQNYHQDQGWPDIAYHVMIDRAGNLYEGRPMEFRGDTFTSYDPSGHFLPCLEGDYNSEIPSDIQMEALAQVCAWAVDRWGVSSTAIGGHRDFAATTCPGGEIYDDIADGSLAARVVEILSFGAPALSYLRGSEAAAVVAAIESGG